MLNLCHLTCDYMREPVGFDFVRPLLGWRIETDAMDMHQAAYRIQVSCEADFSKPLFDTGEVASAESAGVPLAMALAPCRRYYWRVSIRSASGEASAFSGATFFETGRYDMPWRASWIGPQADILPALRSEFVVEKPVRRARLYAAAAGLYVAFLNGERVGDEQLAPGITAYDKWIQYQTYDVTAGLRAGKNALGAWLGCGFYKSRINFPYMPERRNIYGDRLGFIAELAIEYEDGTECVIATDESWRVGQSPFCRAELYDGEVFDAGTFDGRWAAPGFDDSAWECAGILPTDLSLLKARSSVPVRIKEKLPVKKVLHTPDGSLLLDFGQNFAGWVHMDLPAQSGRICLRFGEMLDRDGNLYLENLRTAKAELVYLCDGGPVDYRPCFTFFGFRYACVEGIEAVDPACFTGEAIWSDLEETGGFTCSDERVNQLFRNILWSQRSNFIDNPMDCPQRDERLGWTGDAQIFSATACMNMQADPFFRKYLRDIAAEQAPDGMVPVIVPNVLKGTGIWQVASAGWGDAAVIIPWQLYLYYGDIEVLRRQYPSMRAWVDYIATREEPGKHIFGGFHLGDWLAQDSRDPDNRFGATPVELIATAYYAYSTELVAKTAALLGKLQDAGEYARMCEDIREDFRQEFVSPNGRVVSDSQTALALCLSMGMLREEQRPAAIRQLARRIETDKVKLTSGFLGIPCLCPTLSQVGLNEYAYSLFLSSDCPGWLYEVAMGATTMWERWNSMREDGSFGPVSMNSFNHYAFGAIAEWLYRYVAGISPCEDAPGYRRIRLAPMPNDMLQSAAAHIDTVYGRVSSCWAFTQDGLRLEFTVPPNTQAEIHLPATGDADIMENGVAVQGACHVRGSGTWRYCYRPDERLVSARVPKPEPMPIRPRWMWTDEDLNK